MMVKLMRRPKKRNSGAALPSVLVISTVLILMVISLSNISIQQLQVSKTHKNVDYTYIGSSSMVEKTFSFIQGYINHPDKKYKEGVPVTATTDDKYATYIVNANIWSAVDASINGNAAAKQIDVSNNTAKAVTSVKSVRFLGIVSSDSQYLNVDIGIVVSSSFKNGKNNAGDKPEFAKRTFKIEKSSKRSMKPAAFNGIGDLYASGYLQSIIKGDVKVVGTAPKKAKQPEQYYYGGIYARNNADLQINGSAFVRSFVRVGKYGEGINDNSKIRVRNNIVAQSIQAFGNNDEIFTYGDAFTFDDLEMNGTNSVIAVNRNFFGLSRGNEEPYADDYHDASSGIVNSSVVHNPDEASIEDAKKSKVIINGDVFINGGTFRIDPQTGDFLYPTIFNPVTGLPDPPGSPQIEDASASWYDTEEIPTYKTFDYPNDGVYHGSGINREDDWIYKQYESGNANGYCNLFQVWDIQATNKKDEISYGSQIENWFATYVKDAMNKGYADLPDWKNGYKANSIPKVSGFCHDEMSANGKMYFMIKQSNTVPSGYIDQEDASKVKRAEYVLSSENDYKRSLYYLDSNSSSYKNAPKWTDWSNYTDRNKCDWYNYYLNTVAMLSGLRTPLMDITQDFVKRDYEWQFADIINDYTKNQNNTDTQFNYIGDELLGANKDVNDCVITSNEIDINPTFPISAKGNYLIADYINRTPGVDPSKYYLIVIDDPEMTLEIDEKIKAIIFTRGKIIMKAGAEVQGFIIAAGRGYSSVTGNLDGSAADAGKMPAIFEDGSNLSRLDDGSYASIVFEGSNNPADSSSKAVIDFSSYDPADENDPFNPEKALDYLLKQILNQDTDHTIYNVLYRLFKS